MLVLERGPMDDGVFVVGGVIDQDVPNLNVVELNHRNDIFPALKQGLHGPREAYRPSPPSQLNSRIMGHALRNGRLVNGEVVPYRLPSESQKPPRAYQANVGG